MGWFEDLTGVPEETAAGLGLGAAALYKAYEDLEGFGQRGLELGQDLAQTQLEQTAFRPYTVTTGTGGQFGITQDPTTGQFTYSMAMSPEEQAFQQGMFGGAGQFFQQAQTGTTTTDEKVRVVVNFNYIHADNWRIL